jgi:arylsulfatase
MSRFLNFRKISLSVLILVVGSAIAWKLSVAGKHPNIIVILIDTLRADHLGSFGYERNLSPNLDQFAKESLNFTRAISTSSWTPPSVTSILSGLYPTAHTNQPPKRLTTARQQGNKIPLEVKLLPEILKAKQYRTSAVSSNPWISKDFGFDRGFDRFYYAKHINAEKVVALSKNEIDNFSGDASVPFFLYMHFIDPHEPYLPHSEYSYEGKLAGREYSEEMSQKINMYDSEVQYTDAQLGEFFSYLKTKGLYDNSLIIVVSDHGEAFMEHGSFGHGFNLNIEEVHVPLFIKGLGQSGIVEDSVSHVDILPTILDVLGIDKPSGLPGQSLRDSAGLKQRAGVYSEAYRVFRQRAFSTAAGERLILEMGDTANPKTTMDKKGLYDLIKDPEERHSLEDPALYAELRGYLESVVTKNIAISKPQEVDIPDKTLEQLETLGYIN